MNVVCSVVLTMFLTSPNGQDVTAHIPIEVEKGMTAKQVQEAISRDITSLRLSVAPMQLNSYKVEDVTPEDCDTLAERLNR